MKADVLLEKINTFVWGPWMLVLFMGTGIFLTVRLKFLPWKNLGFALHQVWKNIFHREEDGGEGDISPFQSLMTALAAMMGTGNIVGVATAMVLGGPGALVWMVLSAFIGMATNFTESVLAVKYRRKNPDGDMCGGPMYVMGSRIRPAALGRLLAVLFCIFNLGASLGMGNMTQSNSAAIALKDTFGIPEMLTGGILFCLTLLVLLGGIKSIGKVCGVVVPVMSAAYFLCTLAVIIINFDNLSAGIMEMLHMAFSPKALAGGLGGTIVAGMSKAMRWGVSRGVFSNEAGLGSAPIAAAAARTDSPVRQGYITMTGTFFDTIVVCTATGLAIASSGILGAVTSDGSLLDGVSLTNKVFEMALGPAGRLVITLGITLFAFATIIGWEYYGEKALEYLVLSRRQWRLSEGGQTRALSRRQQHLEGRRPQNTGGHFSKTTITVYRFLYSAAVFAGAVSTLSTVWNFSDIMNALMALPNLLCILMLNKEAAEAAFKFEATGPGRF